MNKNPELYDKFQAQKELWVDCRFITADVPLNRKRVQHMLPLGLRLTREAKATLFVVDYKKPNFTAPYKEAGLLIHVKTLFGKGLHCCWMVVDDDTAMIYGRELLGYPKKMADVTMEEDKDRITAGVSRRGINLLTMTGTRGKPEKKAEPIIGRKIFNASGPGQMLYMQPIWLSRPKELINESYEANVSIALEPSTCDPLARFICGPAFNGRFAVTCIPGARYMFPVGLVGPLWLQRNYYTRYR